MDMEGVTIMWDIIEQALKERRQQPPCNCEGKKSACCDGYGETITGFCPNFCPRKGQRKKRRQA